MLAFVKFASLDEKMVQSSTSGTDLEIQVERGKYKYMSRSFEHRLKRCSRNLTFFNNKVKKWKGAKV